MKHTGICWVLTQIFQYKKSVLLVAVLSVMVRILVPYLYIYATATIVEVLVEDRNVFRLCCIVGVAVVLQVLLSVLDYWLGNLNMENHDALNMREKNLVTKSLLEVPYQKLEGTDLEHRIIQHRDELSREGGIFNKYLTVIENIVCAFFQLGVAVLLLRPFFQTFFVYQGDSFIESVWFGLFVGVGLAGGVILLSTWKARLEQGNMKIRDQYANHNFLFSYYREMICDYKTGKEIRIFKQQPYIIQQINRELIQEGIPLQKKIFVRNAWSAVIGELMVTIVVFGFYLVVGVRALEGVYSLGETVAYVGYFTQIAKGIGEMTGIWGKWRALSPRAELLAGILKDAHLQEEMNKETIQYVPQKIEFRNVNFQYDAERSIVLQNLNISICLGEKIAIVGENGSGKTTFVKLLCGLQNPTEGQILVDGIDRDTYDRSSYFSLFSVVFQDSKLFSFPLGENIAVDGNVDEEKIQRLLKQVNFPSKYPLATMLYRDLDSNGLNLSGGEAQKLELARALYRDAPIIVLDEPTAALDPYAEFQLYEQFDELTRGKTAIYISHRLSSCRFCDKIAVFDHGRLLQFGTHEELVQDRAGRYFALWDAQAKYFSSVF